MFGRLVAGLIVVGLAIGVWALWPAGDSGTTTTTAADAAPTTTNSETTSTTDLVESTTTTDPTGADVITTVAKAEELLRSFWFGWFEGIYDQDQDRIKEVVASQQLLDNARDQFGVMEFSAEPSSDVIEFSSTELLRSDPECVAVWSDVLVPFRGGTTSGVQVLRATEQGWRMVSIWALRGDLWEQDCDSQLEPLQ